MHLLFSVCLECLPDFVCLADVSLCSLAPFDPSSTALISYSPYKGGKTVVRFELLAEDNLNEKRNA